MSNENYLQSIRSISDQIVAAQRPIRILDAVKWDKKIREQFFAGSGRELPRVAAGYYGDNCPLNFDPAEKKAEFHHIEREISRRLGQLSPLASIMRRTCREYQMVVRMLEARGRPEFSYISQELYGASSDVFHAADPTIADLGVQMESVLESVLSHDFMLEQPRSIAPPEAVAELSRRLSGVFPEGTVKVMVSDGIAADAAAGTDYIKLRDDARFSQEDLDVLEAHEGWVHLGTTLNGLRQPYCTFLSKGPPSVTVTQEGLAVLTEIISFRSTPRRLHRLISRVRAVTLAEDGADFIEVYRYMRDKGLDQDDAYTITSRVFRGSTPDGLPFTKDLTYLKGFILTYNFLRLAVARGSLNLLNTLWTGKIVLEDIKVLHQLEQEGVVSKAEFIPPHFADIKGMVTWLSFERFLSSLDFAQLEADYGHLL